MIRFIVITAFILLAVIPLAAPIGKVEQGEITSEALATNLLGDQATRPFKVYLPASYDQSKKRYPVIYALHGYTQNENALVSPSQFVPSAMQPTLDSMIGQRRIGEFIVVFVNATNRLNGSFYLSSPVIGDYETYIARDLVTLIDSKYRTLAARESRGIVGFSMGGWGAMHLALKFPNVFSAVAAESGFYNSRGAWADGLTKQLVPISPANLAQFANIQFPVNTIQALFAGLLPNPQRPSLFTDFPYDWANRQLLLNEERHGRSLEGDVQSGDLPRYLSQPVRLHGLKVIHGTADSLVPISEARAFTNALTSAGVPFEFETHPGNHVFRADLALPFFHKHLAGSQLFVAPPTIAIASDPLRITFNTQSNVVYVLYGTSILNDGWGPAAFLVGTGKPAFFDLGNFGNHFFRLEAKNADQ